MTKPRFQPIREVARVAHHHVLGVPAMRCFPDQHGAVWALAWPVRGAARGAAPHGAHGNLRTRMRRCAKAHVREHRHGTEVLLPPIAAASRVVAGNHRAGRASAPVCVHHAPGTRLGTINDVRTLSLLSLRAGHEAARIHAHGSGGHPEQGHQRSRKEWPPSQRLPRRQAITTCRSHRNQGAAFARIRSAPTGPACKHEAVPGGLV